MSTTIIISAAAHLLSIGVDCVMVDGCGVDLTPAERRLLLHLAGDAERVHSKADLLDAVFPHQRFAGTRKLDSVAVGLRRKLGTGLIVNVWGVGYRLSDPPYLPAATSSGQ